MTLLHLLPLLLLHPLLLPPSLRQTRAPAPVVLTLMPLTSRWVSAAAGSYPRNVSPANAFMMMVRPASRAATSWIRLPAAATSVHALVTRAALKTSRSRPQNVTSMLRLRTVPLAHALQTTAPRDTHAAGERQWRRHPHRLRSHLRRHRSHPRMAEAVLVLAMRDRKGLPKLQMNVTAGLRRMDACWMCAGILMAKRASVVVTRPFLPVARRQFHRRRASVHAYATMVEMKRSTGFMKNVPTWTRQNDVN